MTSLWWTTVCWRNESLSLFKANRLSQNMHFVSTASLSSLIPDWSCFFGTWNSRGWRILLLPPSSAPGKEHFEVNTKQILILTSLVFYFSVKRSVYCRTVLFRRTGSCMNENSEEKRGRGRRSFTALLKINQLMTFPAIFTSNIKSIYTCMAQAKYSESTDFHHDLFTLCNRMDFGCE